MKIEYLDDITDGSRFPQADPGKLTRIYDFDSREAKQLRDAIRVQVIKGSKTLNLSSLDFIKPINCNLSLRTSVSDKGITQLDKEEFVCELTPAMYSEMILLLEPFCKTETNGYQWLYDLDTTIDFLFSPGGTW